MALDKYMTIHFNDGTKLMFEFPEQGPNAAAKQIKLAEFMTSRHVVVEADGDVLVFPIANIKYIALSGARSGTGRGAALPKHAIVGAHLRD
jgi:hypothetical protein